MSSFVVHDDNGKILRTGSCPESMVEIQAGPGEETLRGKADDLTDKISGNGQFRWVQKKTPEEIERDNPKPKKIPEKDRRANLTNGQLQDILDRLKNVEDHRRNKDVVFCTSRTLVLKEKPYSG